MSISLLNFYEQCQDPVQKGLVSQITAESLFLRILHFVLCSGFSYQYSSQVGLGSIAFRSLNEGYSPDAGVINPEVEKLVIMGGEVQIDHQLANKQGGIVRANAIAAKVKRAGLFFDKYVIQGDSSATGRGKEFDGLRRRITGKQLITNATNGGNLTLSKLDDLLDAVVGDDTKKTVILNRNHRRQLMDCLKEEAGGANIADISGVPQNYRGARIETLDSDSDAEAGAILGFDETCGTSDACSSIYCVRVGSAGVDGEYFQGLISSPANQPDGLIELYSGGQLGPLSLDVVEANVGIAVFHGRSVARLKGIKKA